MIARVDQDVGAVMRRLKELGIDGETIVFFTSDNGPHKEGGSDPAFFASGGPLRGIKRDLYEGGIRVPMIVRWPGKVKAGAVSDQVWSFCDFAEPARVALLLFVSLFDAALPLGSGSGQIKNIPVAGSTPDTSKENPKMTRARVTWRTLPPSRDRSCRR